MRGVAATALGTFFARVSEYATDSSTPSLPDMLTFVQEREAQTPGIAGGFLQGAGWSMDEGIWEGLDMKSWFLETLRQSRPEPKTPHVQTLEFYAHEFFAFDAEAIRELLNMGRKHLAVMTATEEPNAIPTLRPLLDEMAASDDPAISAAIREYLIVQEHHAGLRHMS